MSQGFLSVPGGVGVRGIFLVLVILLCKFKKFKGGGICTQVCNELEFSSMLI